MDFEAPKRGKVLSTIESQVLLVLSTYCPGSSPKTTPPMNAVPSKLSLHQMRLLARKLAVARLVHSNSAHSTHIMKRDIYYSNPNLFPNQATTDRLLHQLGSSISATLPELSVLPASRGLVYGPIHWLDDGTEVSASVIPRGIPLGAFECEDVSAVLVVEKESIFGELVSNGISDVLRCLIVTAKGYPNLQTLNFLRRLASSQRASAYVLTDADPFGLDIFLHYRNGSSVNYFEPLNDCHWIGIHLQDVLEAHRIPLTLTDKKTGSRLWEQLADSNAEDSAQLRAELRLMASCSSKCEMEAVIGSHWSRRSLQQFLIDGMQRAGLSWTSIRDSSRSKSSKD